MSRAKLYKGQQMIFLNRVAQYLNSDWNKIAKVSNICMRTLNDWRREKNSMSYEALLRLHNISGIPVPKLIKILPEFWSVQKASRLGAIKRNKIYGNPGTPEGRRKGGMVSQRLFRLNPVYAKKIEVRVKKKISYPAHSIKFAEFIGI